MAPPPSSTEAVFTDIYRRNGWGDAASLSGTGSNLAETARLRARLPGLLTALRCRTLLDVPCGDFFWMKEVALPVDYIGGDIVPDVVAANRARYENARRRFVQIDLVADPLPAADAIFCRDCLVHLPNALIARALANIKRSGATYLITTTFPDKDENRDIDTGRWRPINLQRAPFHLPPPRTLIVEDCPYPRYRDKSLGVWAVAAIPDAREEEPVAAGLAAAGEA